MFSRARISDAGPVRQINGFDRLIPPIIVLMAPKKGHSETTASHADSQGPRPGDAAMVFPDDGRLEAMAEFAAGAGHEINNPVATIVGRVQLLLKDEDSPERRRALMAIGAQAYRIRDMIGDAMLFARPPAPGIGRVSLNSAVQEVVAELGSLADEREARVLFEDCASVEVSADPVQLRIVVSALVRNSLEAVPSDSVVRIVVLQDRQPAPRRVARLEVIDRGQGLSDEDRVHLFDPFYCGRQAGRGLGFGLSKSWRIVTMHGGRIYCKSELGGETRFVVEWPMPVE